MTLLSRSEKSTCGEFLIRIATYREQGVSEDEAKQKLYHHCDICGKSYVNSAGLRLVQVNRFLSGKVKKIKDHGRSDLLNISNVFVYFRIHKRHVHEKFSENVPCDVCGRAFR